MEWRPPIHVGVVALEKEAFGSAIFWPSTRPKNAIQGDALQGSDTFQWQLGEEIAWAEIG